MVLICDFMYPLVLNGGIALLSLVLFSFMRPRHQDVYAPRISRKGMADVPDGFLSWLALLKLFNDDYVATDISLDAWVLLRFLRMGMEICIFLLIIGMHVSVLLDLYIGVGALMPINFTATDDDDYDANQSLTDFDHLNIRNIPSHSHRLWAHVGAIWLATLVVYYYLLKVYKEVFLLI